MLYFSLPVGSSVVVCGLAWPSSLQLHVPDLHSGLSQVVVLQASLLQVPSLQLHMFWRFANLVGVSLLQASVILLHVISFPGSLLPVPTALQGSLLFVSVLPVP
jgi:hypothetical protein